MSGSEAGEGETLDAIGDGELRLLQRRDGYRFNLDAVLLADFALQGGEAERPLRAVDLGTGCGVVALLLKSRRPGWTVAALELQPRLADLARRNADLNRLDVAVHEGDLRAPPEALGREFELVVANPPYFAQGSGHPSDDAENALARHDGTATPDDLARAARRLVRSNGAAAFVYPAARLATLFEALSHSRLAPARLRLVHPRAGEAAGLVLVEARPDSKRPLAVLPPLVVHDEAGFTPEVRRMLSRSGRTG